MFASILRRWRLVTPLVLVSLLSMMVAGGMLTTASAAPARGRLHFAFAGDAAGMVDLTQFPAFSECFSGQIESHSADLDAIAIKESGCPNENLDAVDLTPFSGPIRLAHADATEARIKSDHTNTEGHVITDVINFGETSIFGVDDALACAANTNGSTSGTTVPLTPAQCLEQAPLIRFGPEGSLCNPGTFVIDKVTGVRTFIPSPEPNECSFSPRFGGDVQAGDFAHVRAEAECEKKHGRVAGHASAAAISSFDDLDMEAASGGHTERATIGGTGGETIDVPVGPVSEFVRELKPTAFTFTGGSVTYVTSDELGRTTVLIVNERSVLKSDDFAAISANALHFIEQGNTGSTANAVNAGGIIENILFAHAFAQIHCHSGTFSFEDPIAAN